MSKNKYEGQMDFLGLLNEYTDSQGATVRVREPAGSKLKPVVKASSKFSVREAEPEQLKLNLEDFVAVKAQEPPKEKKEEPVKVEPVKEEPVKAEPVIEELKPEPEPVKEEPKPEPVKEVEKPAENPVEKPAEKPVPKNVQKPASDGAGSAEILFKQCKKCWCFDCKHNSRNEGVPRDICGTQMPCPACESCISEDQATICEIGNAKEGCRLRAQEEGILIPEEPA